MWAGDDDVPIIYPGSTERTSFAERDEPKGFFELALSPDELGRWRVIVQRFIELGITPGVHPRSLRDYLHERIAILDENAIVRLKPQGQVGAAIRSSLTATFLRSVFPRSMSVQVSAGLYNQPQDIVERAQD